MFGSLGYWASSKGMVTVPNLIGLTEAQASTALSNKVLSYVKITNTETQDVNLINKVASQSLVADSLTNYESIIEISLYQYVCIPVYYKVEPEQSYIVSFCNPTTPQVKAFLWRTDNCGGFVNTEWRQEFVGGPCVPPPPACSGICVDDTSRPQYIRTIEDGQTCTTYIMQPRIDASCGVTSYCPDRVVRITGYC
jgi:hypothetical protein